jgi:hypothetical protein
MNLSNNTKELKVNKRRIQNCLQYLCKNNPGYIKHGIKINNNNLNLLPDNQIPNDLHIIQEASTETDDSHIGAEIVDENAPNNDFHTFIEEPIDDLKEVDKIKHKINWPRVNREPINEFQFDGICSLLFPKLFPMGLGDPTNKSRLRKVTETQGTLK